MACCIVKWGLIWADQKLPAITNLPSLPQGLIFSLQSLWEVLNNELNHMRISPMTFTAFSYHSTSSLPPISLHVALSLLQKLLAWSACSLCNGT